jgi:hypothetical protein
MTMVPQTVQQHGVVLGVGCVQAVWGKTVLAEGYWRVGCYTNVVRGVVPHFWMCPIGLMISGCSYRGLLRGGPPANTFTLGIDVGAMRPGVDRDVTPLRFRLCLQFIKSLGVRAGLRRLWVPARQLQRNAM